MSAEPVRSAEDPRLVRFRDLHGARRGERVVAEGALVVRRLLAARRFRVDGVLGTVDALGALADALRGVEAPVYVAAPHVLRDVVGFPFHRGCLAVGEEVQPPGLDDVLAPGPALLVALDRVSDPDNVGSAVRSAEAFGAAAVLLSPGCGDALAPKALRVSMGAALALPVVRLADWVAALDRLEEGGTTLVALSPDGALDVRELAVRRPRRAVLLCGSEHDGLGPAARARATLAVRIPLAPGVNSLNVAAAAAIALHHLHAPEGAPPHRVAMSPPER